MNQQSLANQRKINRALQKLKKVREQCSVIKTELTSIKNLTFKTKRSMMIEIRSVRDTLKSSLKKNTINRSQENSKENSHSRTLSSIDDENKENSFKMSNLTDKFEQIEVGLNISKEKSVAVANKNEEKKVHNFNSKLLLELQEIKLLEQRGSLISKANQRASNYYSEHRKQRTNDGPLR